MTFKITNKLEKEKEQLTNEIAWLKNEIRKIREEKERMITRCANSSCANYCQDNGHCQIAPITLDADGLCLDYDEPN